MALARLIDFLCPLSVLTAECRETASRPRPRQDTKGPTGPDGLVSRNKNRGLKILREVHGRADVGTKNREVLVLVIANSMVHQSGKTVLHTDISEVAFGFPGDFAPWLFTAASVFQRDVNHDGVVVTFDAKMVGHVGRGMEIGARTSRAPNVVDHFYEHDASACTNKCHC